MDSQTFPSRPREKILDAAELLFARRGYTGIGLSEIADAVGLGKSSLFHHFRSKAQLYAAVLRRILEDIEALLAQALARDGSPAQKLDRWAGTLVDILGEHPTYARLLLRSLFEDDDFSGAQEEHEVNVILARILGGITGVLREGGKCHEFHEANPAHTVQSLVGLIVYHFASGDFGSRLFHRPLFDPEEVRRRKEEVLTLLHRGLLVTPS